MRSYLVRAECSPFRPLEEKHSLQEQLEKQTLAHLSSLFSATTHSAQNLGSRFVFKNSNNATGILQIFSDFLPFVAQFLLEQLFYVHRAGWVGHHGACGQRIRKLRIRDLTRQIW